MQGYNKYKQPRARVNSVALFGYFGVCVFALLGFALSYRLGSSMRAFTGVVWAVATLAFFGGIV